MRRSERWFAMGGGFGRRGFGARGFGGRGSGRRGGFRGGTSFGGGSPFQVTPWVKRLLMINAAAFVLSVAIGPDLIADLFAFHPGRLLTRPWGLFTYMFVHRGLFHLLINLLFIFFFGPPLETRWGSDTFIRFYLVCGLGGALLSFLFSDVPIVGASGACYGMMLAFAIFWPNASVYIWGLVPVKAKWLVIFLMAISLASAIGPTRDGVAHLAHLGGGIAGAALAWSGWLPRFGPGTGGLGREGRRGGRGGARVRMGTRARGGSGGAMRTRSGTRTRSTGRTTSDVRSRGDRSARTGDRVRRGSRMRSGGRWRPGTSSSASGRPTSGPRSTSGSRRRSGAEPRSRRRPGPAPTLHMADRKKERDPQASAELDQVDAVLDKISAQGIESLTDEERRLLDRVSRRTGAN